EEDILLLGQQIKSQGEVDDLEIELMTREHEKKYCILSITKEIEDVKNNFYFHGIIHDITHIKKAEKITLQVEKLAAAGRLVRTLAHEVRNPLNNINLSVEHLREETANEGE